MRDDYYSVCKDENGKWKLISGPQDDVCDKAEHFGPYISVFIVPSSHAYDGHDFQTLKKEAQKKCERCWTNIQQFALEGRIHAAFNEMFEYAEARDEQIHLEADIFYLNYKGGDVSDLVSICTEQAKINRLCMNEAVQIEFLRQVAGEKGIKACIKALKDGLPNYEEEDDE